MKVGLFFGSFNPVHVGHMVIANYFVSFTDLQQIWFVVSPHNPLKDKQSLLSDYHRLEIVNRAIENDSRFKASNIEFGLTQPNYTIHTLVHLSERNPHHQFVLMMGSDNLQSFHKWKNYEAILEHYELYVYPRNGFDGGPFRDHSSVRWIDAPMMEISSTFIRKSIAQGADVRHFMPESAYTFIDEMNFYRK